MVMTASTDRHRPSALGPDPAISRNPELRHVSLAAASLRIQRTKYPSDLSDFSEDPNDRFLGDQHRHHDDNKPDQPVECAFKPDAVAESER